MLSPHCPRSPLVSNSCDCGQGNVRQLPCTPLHPAHYMTRAFSESSELSGSEERNESGRSATHTSTTRWQKNLQCWQKLFSRLPTRGSQEYASYVERVAYVQKSRILNKGINCVKVTKLLIRIPDQSKDLGTKTLLGVECQKKEKRRSEGIFLYVCVLGERSCRKQPSLSNGD